MAGGGSRRRGSGKSRKRQHPNADDLCLCQNRLCEFEKQHRILVSFTNTVGSDLRVGLGFLLLFRPFRVAVRNLMQKKACIQHKVCSADPPSHSFGVDWYMYRKSVVKSSTTAGHKDALMLHTHTRTRLPKRARLPRGLPEGRHWYARGTAHEIKYHKPEISRGCSEKQTHPPPEQHALQLSAEISCPVLPAVTSLRTSPLCPTSLLGQVTPHPLLSLAFVRSF